MSTTRFNIKRDLKYPFFCLGCLVGKPLSKRSEKDARYCVDCQPIIEYDYSLLADKGAWKRYKPVKPDANLEAIETLPKEMDTHEEKTKLSTLNQNPVTVDNFRPRGRQKTYKKRELPDELIRQLNSNGMGSKTIASELKKQGIVVSYKTIQRVLSGERR